MQNEKIKLNKRRDFGETLSTTFEFIGQNFKGLFKLWLYVVAPIALLTAITSSLAQTQMFRGVNAIENNPYIESDPFGALGGVFTPTYFLSLFLSVVAYGVLIAAINQYLKAYHESETTEVQFANIWRGFPIKVLWVLGATILIYMVVFFACLFLVIPGIYLGVVLSIVYPIYFFERKSLGDAFKRCFELMSGNWWASFGLLIVVGLIVGMISGFLGMMGGLSMGISAAFVMEEPTLMMSIWTAVVTFVSSILNMVVVIAIVIWYFSLVEQKEGSSVMEKIDQIGMSDEELDTMFR